MRISDWSSDVCSSDLERRDEVADDVLGGIVQHGREAVARRQPRLQPPGNVVHQQAVLRHREGGFAGGLAVPARDAGKAARDVLPLAVARRGCAQVPPPAEKHPLPGSLPIPPSCRPFLLRPRLRPPGIGSPPFRYLCCLCCLSYRSHGWVTGET